MEPETIIEFENGIEAQFADGASIELTLDGVFPCSQCRSIRCVHFHAALPAFVRRKWELAEANWLQWGRKRYDRIGIDARIFFPPGTLGTPAVQFDGDEPVLLPSRFGTIATFADGGHVYISPTHPNGQTRCLKCGELGCEHYRRALALMRVQEFEGGGER